MEIEKMEDTARKPRGRPAPAEESYEVIKAQEALVVQVQTSIMRGMRERRLKQVDLAERLGVSPARVSQLFGDDSQNLTLRTIAKIFHVLGARCELVERPIADPVAATAAADDRPGDEPGNEEAALATCGILSYHFSRPPSATAMAAARRFSLRRRCEMPSRVLEQARA